MKQMTPRRKAGSSWVRFSVAAVLLAGTSLLLRAQGRALELPFRQQFESFPRTLGDWTGRDVGIQPDVRQVLGDGDFLQRIYRREAGGAPVSLFVAYFPDQRPGSTMHSPQNCLPGSGWTPLSHTRIRIALGAEGSITVNRYEVAKGSERELVLYWYQIHGRAVADEYWAKFFLVADSIRMHRRDGAMTSIGTPLGLGESVEAGQTRAAEFARRITPLLSAYIPR